MSDNKEDGKLDYRNVKVSQFGGAQSDRMEFSEYQSAKKTYKTNAILKEGYSHIIQILDSENRPTSVEYYQASATAIDEIQFVADVAKDKAGAYIQLQRYLDKKTQGLYYVVDGEGVRPHKSDIETPVNISENDPASVICLATQEVLATIEEIKVTSKSVLSTSIQIEYEQFGETSLVDVATSGFTASRIQEGSSFLVGEVFLSYSDDGFPIYNGNEMVDLKYNLYTASFEVDGTTNKELIREAAVLANLKTLELFGIALDNYVLADDEIVSLSDGTLIKAG